MHFFNRQGFESWRYAQAQYDDQFVVVAGGNDLAGVMYNEPMRNEQQYQTVKAKMYYTMKVNTHKNATTYFVLPALRNRQIERSNTWTRLVYDMIRVACTKS